MGEQTAQSIGFAVPDNNEGESKGKMVYLFELDSVRKLEYEIEKGQKTLYLELLKGNRVVISLNQIVDSLIMIDLLDICEKTKTRDQILALFKNKRIYVSEYGNTKTVITYVKEKVYNIQSKKGRFLFSKLEFLNGLDSNSSVFEDIYDVLGCTKNINLVDFSGISQEEKKTLREYLMLIMELHTCIEYLPEKSFNRKKLSQYIIETIDNINGKENELAEKISAGAIKENEQVNEIQIRTAIKSLRKIIHGNIEDRSSYYKRISEIGIDEISKKFAKTIVDISYNYKIAESIEENIEIEGEKKNKICEYFLEHNFNRKKNRKSKILYWQGIVRMTSDKKSRLIKETKNWNAFVFSKILRSTIYTLMFLAFVGILSFLSKQIVSIIASFCIFITIEIISYLQPVGVIDIAISLVNVAIDWKMYINLKKGKETYIPQITIKFDDYVEKIRKKTKNE